jgi:lactam utilization protein B
MRVGTICIHGDNPAAVPLVRAVKDALEQAGFAIAAPER